MNLNPLLFSLFESNAKTWLNKIIMKTISSKCLPQVSYKRIIWKKPQNLFILCNKKMNKRVDMVFYYFVWRTKYNTRLTKLSSNLFKTILQSIYWALIRVDDISWISDIQRNSRMSDIPFRRRNQGRCTCSDNHSLFFSSTMYTRPSGCMWCSVRAFVCRCVFLLLNEINWNTTVRLNIYRIFMKYLRCVSMLSF